MVIRAAVMNIAIRYRGNAARILAADPGTNSLRQDGVPYHTSNDARNGHSMFNCHFFVVL